MKRRIINKYMHSMPIELVEGKKVRRISIDAFPKRVLWKCIRQMVKDGKLAIMNEE